MKNLSTIVISFGLVALLWLPATVTATYNPSSLAQMGFSGNSTATAISARDQVHPAVTHLPPLVARGMEVVPGVIVGIVSFSDATPRTKATATIPHNLASGDIVVLVGSDIEVSDSTPYYGIYTVTVTSDTEFEFDAPFAGTATASAYRPDVFKVATAGMYELKAFGSFSASKNKQTFAIMAFVNKTVIPTFPIVVSAEEKNTYYTASKASYLDLKPGDCVWYGVTNLNSDGDFTLNSASITLAL